MPPMPPAAAAKKSPKALKRGGRPSQSKIEDDAMEEWKKSKQLLKPSDQLELSDADLKEPVARQLVITNPQLPDSLVEFDYATGGYKLIEIPENLVVVYEAMGTQLHKDSPEARQQMIEEGIDPATFGEEEDVEILQPLEEEVLAGTSEKEKAVEEPGDETSRHEEDEEEGEGGEKEAVEEAEGGEGEGEAKEGETEGGAAPVPSGKKKKLTNQFNFCERGALTYNNPTRAQETQTVPPPMATFSANVLAWVIYDAYNVDYEQQQREKEQERLAKEKDKAPVGRQQPARKNPLVKAQLSEAVQGRVLECWRVLERMVNQNSYDDIAKDYRYWEDPSDEFREEEGTLLPLWKFSYDKVRKNTVTDVEWNPHYYDLFAVGFGFLDFMKPIEEGAVCLFTLKNPSYPDYICMTDSAVLTVDTHPSYPYMVVVGLYDGSVVVFNVHVTCKTPAYRSNSVLNKHRGIVWEVKWAADLPDGELNFFSVSTDGKVNNWVLMQNELAVTTIITLNLTIPGEVIGPDGTKLVTRSCASCVKFHPKQPSIYLVGTEEGLIYKCSTAYSSMYLMTYRAHHMPVYRIDFNRYEHELFISCSGDWRVKIWEDNTLEPLFAFDLGACVGDVKWAPYSSTVFAAVTTEGKVYVFDLNVNKYKPICVQAIVSRKSNKLTTLTFNPKLPILIVGDERGTVYSVKLSPNLRIPCKAPKKQQHLDQWTLQCMKLDKLLSLVREPAKLKLPEDKAGSEQS